MVIRSASFASTTDSGFTKEQLYSTASYQSGDLTGIDLSDNDLTDWDFSGMAIRSASFAYTTGMFGGPTGSGFTEEQLYSTASYQSGDLTGIDFWANDLRGWDFAGKNLIGTDSPVAWDGLQPPVSLMPTSAFRIFGDLVSSLANSLDSEHESD